MPKRELEAIAARQAGVFSRSQARECEVTDEAIAANIAGGRWRRLRFGVYTMTNGPLTRIAVLWAVVLRAGPGAVLSHETAAELDGIIDQRSGMIHVTVPKGRRPTKIPGVVVHQSSRIDAARHPTRTPPRTRLEETILDLTQAARDLEGAAEWIARAVGARRTTAQKLIEALAGRPRMRWRQQIGQLLRDVADGCNSVMELRYRRDVETAHGLPHGKRQVRVDRDGRRRYRDIEYEGYDTGVELDGRLAHPDTIKDMDRDNETVEQSKAPLRYGYLHVWFRPCRTARQVGRVLANHGWVGRLSRCCRAGCVIP